VILFLFLGGLGLGGAGAVAGLVLPARVGAPAAAALTSGGCAAAFAAAASVLVSGVTVTGRSAAVLPLTGVMVSVDRFGAVFVVTAAVAGAAASCYSAGYLARGHGSRATAALLPLFVTSLLLVPAAASIATFMAAWELMALSSLLLLLTGHRRPEARAAAQWYAAMTHAGAAAILLTLVLISAHAGGQSFAAIRAHAGTLAPAARSAGFILALAGFASKAGAVPLHVWLPRAHPEAPGPVSALMSGAMVNLGVYGIVRTGDWLLGGGVLWWWLAVAGLGVVPGAVLPVLARAAASALGGGPPAGALRAGIGIEAASGTDVIEPSLLAAALLVLLALAWAVVRVRARAGVRRAQAWGCGGEPQTARMEYTATSFAEPLQRVFDDVLRPSHDLDVSHLAESRYFEDAITYHSRVDDAIERCGYRPVIGLVRRWGEVARHAQNGSLHRYLGYGLAALVIVLVVLA
jgi:hypothetical protein